MPKSIALIHEKIFDFLLSLHEKDKNFLFIPRKINNKSRLDEGYWFIGNDNYLQISFWDGTDFKEKIHNIGFVVTDDEDCYIEIAGQDSLEKAEFLRIVVEKLDGFKRIGKKNKWIREYDGKDFIENLKDFINKDKPVIDSLIRKHNPKGISLPDEKFYNLYILPIINLRTNQQNINKVVRISWNTAGWKFPSGPKGKSRDPNSYEAMYGYGHEEWLFDKSRIVNGYHYAFLEPLSVKSGKHVGKTYNISLYTIEGGKRKFYVGNINNVICISPDEAIDVFHTYKNNGWLDEMTEEIKRVGGKSEAFIENFPKFVFNVKFKFDDVHLLDELEEISDTDTNITTNRFRLLSKKTDFVIKKIPVEDDESEGALRNESRRKAVFKGDIEYDPYHNKMQNALKKLLSKSYNKEYAKVCIEKGRVDIKAKTHDGKWHYFEIKTATPKISIRMALGQVMEYAYWPNVEKAEKLIVIGDAEPDEETKRYLLYVRKKFSLPIYYRCLDIEENTLSGDF